MADLSNLFFNVAASLGGSLSPSPSTATATAATSSSGSSSGNGKKATDFFSFGRYTPPPSSANDGESLAARQLILAQEQHQQQFSIQDLLEEDYVFISAPNSSKNANNSNNNSNNPSALDEPLPEELFVDDTMSTRNRIVSYVASELVIHRVYIIRELTNLFQDLNNEEIHEATSLILELFDDLEPIVRSILLEQLPDIFSFLIKNNDKEFWSTKLIDNILPKVLHLILEKQTSVQASASTCLVGLCPLLTAETLETIVFPFLANMIDFEEEQRIECITILKSITSSIKEDEIVKFVIPIIDNASRDQFFRVRQAAADCLPYLVQVLSTENVLTHVHPIFVFLCNDKIWGVRKSCAHALPSIAMKETEEQRKNELRQIFDQLVEDVSRWVKNAALESLGDFIATFSLTNEIVPINLIKQFRKIPINEPELAAHCASSFAGVVKAIGRENWHLVREFYFRLAGDMQWKVRCSLSHSIHEIAKTIGTQSTEADLCPIFEMFLYDLDEVRAGPTSHYAEFIEVLSPVKRLAYLEDLVDHLDVESGWQVRQIMATQMEPLAHLYPVSALVSYMIPLCNRYARDDVAMIRLAVIPAFATILNKMVDASPRSKDLYYDGIRAFAYELSFTRRQYYVFLFDKMVENCDHVLLLEEFLPTLLQLVLDPVPNVRLVVGRVLYKVRHVKRFSDLESINEAIQTLQQDPDNDVRYFANFQGKNHQIDKY